MAYIRGEFYIWETGSGPDDYVSFSHGSADDEEPPGRIKLPVPVVEEFVAMYWTRYLANAPAKQGMVLRRVYEQHGGNFGADGVAEALGQPTVMDTVLREARERGTDVHAMTDAQLARDYNVHRGDESDDVIGEIENEIAYRARIPLDETEQGFSEKAQALVNTWVGEHLDGDRP